MRTTIKRLIGDLAENKALKLLKQHNLKLICKNYSCQHGEIDIIMQDKDELVFVEVRYRKDSSFCDPISTINLSKQRKIYKTAQHYMQRYKINSPARFDVVGITKNSKPEWLQNAFSIE
jgi:putative endonuclease